MVGLHASLLALTFATGLVLASSDDYERRDSWDNVDVNKFLEHWRERHSRRLNERSDTFDEPEARGLFGELFRASEDVGKLALKGKAGSIAKAAKSAGKLEHHGESVRKVEKHLKPATRIEKKLKPSQRIVKHLKPSKESKKKMVKQLKRAGKHAGKQLNQNNNGNNGNQNSGSQNRINQDLERARKEVADADRYLPANHQYHVQRRGFEDDEELSRRDLDAEEVFEREYYDVLDERDTFDDLD